MKLDNLEKQLEVTAVVAVEVIVTVVLMGDRKDITFEDAGGRINALDVEHL